LLSRCGHTEAAVDLARLGGCYPAAVICEVMNDDGTMARQDQLTKFAERHNLMTVTVADLTEYRRRTDTSGRPKVVAVPAIPATTAAQVTPRPLPADSSAPPAGDSSVP
jgi:hypothetical protein